MKNLSLLSFALVAFALIGMSFTNPGNGNEKLTADVEKSDIIWKGYKVTGSHTGTINLKSGALDFDGDNLVGGTFEIDMTSINCTDLSGEYKGKLEGHLKSDDFFGVKSHPTAKFLITKVVHKGTPGDYKVIGNLTIKDTTKEIKFFTNVKEEGGKKVAVAEMTIDRSDFDVRYGSGSFFGNLGDKTIYDEFDLEVTLVSE